MTMLPALDVGLAVLVLAARRLDDRRARDLRRGRRLRHLRPAAGARLGAPRRRRRGADRGRDRQRLDRRAAARCGGPPAGRPRRAAAAERPGDARAPRRCGRSRRRSRRRSRPACCPCPIPRPRSRRRPPRTLGATGVGNPVTARADGLSRDGHAAGEGRAPARAGRRLVAGARPTLGRASGAAPPRPIRTACSPSSRGCCRPWASSRASTSSGWAPTIPAARSRAAPSSPPCGCSS